ncbi:MAG: 1-(5-phosphoribosyl)-5-amino-4-imidazole-carboxylate carboxylase, partial [Actinomycetes bacterium]
MTAPDPGFTDLGFARVDTHRAERTGDPEVVYGAGKTPQQTVDLLGTLHAAHPERAVLATRLTEEASAAVAAALPDAVLDGTART